MTREEFKKILKKKGYSYELVGDKIVVTHDGYVDLTPLKTLPPGVVFKNGDVVFLVSLETISPGVEFRNRGDVNLESLVGARFHEWYGNIEGIEPNRLLNKMIADGLFDRRR